MPFFFLYRHSNKIHWGVVFLIMLVFNILLFTSAKDSVLSLLSTDATKLFSTSFQQFISSFAAWSVTNFIVFLAAFFIGDIVRFLVYVALKIRCNWVMSGTTVLFNGKSCTYHIGNEGKIKKLLAVEGELRIMYVCNRHKADILFVITSPARHHDVIRVAYNYSANHESNGEQGFVTSKGDFVDRVTAKLIAIKANQLLPRHSNGDDLFTECIW